MVVNSTKPRLQVILFLYFVSISLFTLAQESISTLSVESLNAIKDRTQIGYDHLILQVYSKQTKPKDGGLTKRVVRFRNVGKPELDLSKLPSKTMGRGFFQYLVSSPISTVQGSRYHYDITVNDQRPSTSTFKLFKCVDSYGFSEASADHWGCAEENKEKVLKNVDIPVRDYFWSNNDWFAYTSPKKNENSERETISINLGKIVEESVVDCAVGEDSNRPSVSATGLTHREMDLYAMSLNRVRIVTQRGVAPAISVDDNLVLADFCLKELSDENNENTECTSKDSDMHIDICSQDEQWFMEESALPEKNGWEGFPSFSPDGKWLAYLRTDNDKDSKDPDHQTDESEEMDLWIMENTQNLESMTKARARNLTRGLDYPVVNYRWSCRGECIVVQISRGGVAPLFQIDYQEGINAAHDYPNIDAWGSLTDFDCDPLIQSRNDIGVSKRCGATKPKHKLNHAVRKKNKYLDNFYIKDFEISSSGRHLFYVKSALDHSNEQVFECKRGSNERRAKFVLEDCQPVINFESSTGVFVKKFEELGSDELNLTAVSDETKVPENGMVVFPSSYYESSNYDDKANSFPVIFYIHGGPQNTMYNRFDYLLHHLASGVRSSRGDKNGDQGSIGQDGFVLVIPNSIGSSGFGREYRESVVGEWGGDVYEDIVNTINYFSDQLKKINLDQIYVMGESFGGYMVNFLQVNGGREDPKLIPKISGFIPMFGVYDLKSIPCEMDQDWFPYHQFGYYEDCDNNPMYESRFDPRHFMEKDANSKKHFKSVPMLVFHGNLDERVVLSQSKKLAAAVHKIDDKLLQACEVAGGHGFDTPALREVYFAIIDWVNCTHEGDNDCTLPYEEKLIDCSPNVVNHWKKSIDDNDPYMTVDLYAPAYTSPYNLSRVPVINRGIRP